MSSWTNLGGWLRAGLVTLAAAGSTVLTARAPSQSPHALSAGGPAPVELAADVDGDGRVDKIGWRRYGDDYWLDVSLAAADGSFDLRSSTRVAPADGNRWALSARDLDGDGRADLVMADAHGREQVWLSDGRGFTEASQWVRSRAGGEVAQSAPVANP